MWSKMTPVYLHKDKVVYIPKYIWKEPLREMRWKEPFVVIRCLNKKVSLYDCVMLRYELIPFSVDWNTPLGRTPAEIVFLPWLILHDDRRKLVVFTLWLGLKHWRFIWPKQRIPHLRILYKKKSQLWLTSKLESSHLMQEADLSVHHSVQMCGSLTDLLHQKSSPTMPH